MNRTYVFAATIGLLAVAVTGFIIAQDKPTAQRAAEEQAIREASKAFAQAFQKGDAQAVGAFWTEEGEYIDDEGKQVHGRAALGKAYADFFAKRAEVTADIKIDQIRFLSPDTAVEEGTFTVKAKNRPANASRYSTLWVRQGGRWQIALLKEWSDETTGRANLEDVAWLIGTWESDGPELKARTTYDWAENKVFIRVRYTITPKKDAQKAIIGTQMIGIDPGTGTIRAWTFDADGSIGDAFWEWDGDRWVITSAGTLADGSETTAQNFLTRTGDDTFTWKSVKRTLNGETLPDIGPVTVKRVAAAK
jgi:uncharacterized protein (TIGR02246 family)